VVWCVCVWVGVGVWCGVGVCVRVCVYVWYGGVCVECVWIVVFVFG